MEETKEKMKGREEKKNFRIKAGLFLSGSLWSFISYIFYLKSFFSEKNSQNQWLKSRYYFWAFPQSWISKTSIKTLWNAEPPSMRRETWWLTISVFCWVVSAVPLMGLHETLSLLNLMYKIVKMLGDGLGWRRQSTALEQNPFPCKILLTTWNLNSWP